MQKLDYQPQTHLFICCRQRKGQDCCASKGAIDLVNQLKDWIKDSHLTAKVKVSQSSCLGYCQSGVTGCLYPQNQWLHQIKLEDIPEIKKMLKGYT